MKKIAVAIDGPSGAGKSSVAKAVAEKFRFIYVDTGAIYRTVGYAAQKAGLDSKDAQGVIRLLPELNIEIRYDDSGMQRMYMDGCDVSEQIRTPKSSIYASDVSALPEVRAFLMDIQRDMAKKHNVIMDGRDIGTAVLPDAQLKIFLTASTQARARRRCAELEQKGMPCPFDEVLRDIEYRDVQDSSRKASPLRAAQDAIVVDSSDMDFASTVEEVSRLVEAKMSL